MKKAAIILITLACVTAAAAGIYNQSNFSSLGRIDEPLPKGTAPGQDNLSGRGLHHQGEQCGRCHSEGGRAHDPNNPDKPRLWTLAGTLYHDRTGNYVQKGGEIILEDREGNIISVTSNESGNFWTDAPVASNPYAVVSHGGAPMRLYTLDGNGNLLTPAPVTDQRSWQYKAWVRKGGAIRPMVTIAPVGSATAPDGGRMSCSMHHAAMGSRGALWTTVSPTLPSYPATGLSYRKHIYPILRSKCAPCHIPGSTITRQVTKSDIDPDPDIDPRPTTVDYSSGLDLMFYEGSNQKDGVRSVVDVSNPEESKLLLKTLRGSKHGGGAFWGQDSPDYLALKQWISEGSLKN